MKALMICATIAAGVTAFGITRDVYLGLAWAGGAALFLCFCAIIISYLEGW